MTRPVRRQRISSPVSGLEKLESRALLSSVTPASSDVEVIDVQTPADLIITGEDVVEELIRIVSVEYQDGVSAPAGSDRVSARVISNEVANQTESIVNDRSLTDFIWIWGQFIDHDIDLSENANPAEPLPIEVLAGDVFFDPSGTGEETIGFNRSVYVDGSESTDGVRQQMNQITSLLDGSVIYGSTTERTDALREFEGGRLLTSAGDLLPFNTVGLENAGGTSDSLFLAGDIRVNENVALSAMQTIWVREHNRIAAEIHEANPDLNDEQIFQEARSLVTAELQAITYNEFLPALLGNEALSRYSGFDSTVDSSISNIFFFTAPLIL
jgi:peroxidase